MYNTNTKLTNKGQTAMPRWFLVLVLALARKRLVDTQTQVDLVRLLICSYANACT
jgi:hypothetical protein